MAEWTTTPMNGAFYWQWVKGARPEVVWVFNDAVLGLGSAVATRVENDVRSGCEFYGPLDQPPLMPDRSSESVKK